MLGLVPAEGLLEGLEMLGPSIGDQPAGVQVHFRGTVPDGPEQTEHQLVLGDPHPVLATQAHQQSGMGGRQGHDTGVAPEIVQPLGGRTRVQGRLQEPRHSCDQE